MMFMDEIMLSIMKGSQYYERFGKVRTIHTSKALKQKQPGTVREV